ncbi:hypothetical protein CW713_08545 [Methanophagales archaeon]|nr:MAG: hypothetical protein CW713_08545 [Methanophagales archaeon]
MRREVVVGILMVCLLLEAIPVTTIAQPSPPIEFEGIIQDKDIITFKTEGGYEIGLHNNLAYSELDVFFDGVYQDTLPKGAGRTWFTVDHEITHVIVAAAEDSYDEGRAWYRYLSEEDWQEYYIQLKKSEIEDIDPAKEGIQVKGIIEIPFTYNVPDGLEWNAEIIYLDGKKIWCTLDTRDYSNPKVKLTSPATIKLATHLFENGIHNITVELVDSECGEEFCSFYVVEKSCRDTVFLDFQNTFVVPENWEKRYSEPGIIPDFHPDFGVDELKKNYTSIYNELKNEWGYEDYEIIGAEAEFVSSKEIGLYKLENALRIGSTLWSIRGIGFNVITVARTGEGLFKLGKSLGLAILSEGVFIATEEIYKSTNPAEELRYDEAPVGDLAGNRYAVYAMTELEKEYRNAEIKWKGKFPFFLNEKGEWQFYFGNSYEIEDASWKGTGVDCVEWIKKPPTIEEGETGTFKLRIKDNVIPNLYTEEMHLDIELPKGVKISNVKIKGEETKILHAYPGVDWYYVLSQKEVEGKARVIINIPKESVLGSEEVSFDITVKEKKQEPIEILYGIIPGKVYEDAQAELGPTTINPITLPDIVFVGYCQRGYYYPFELKQSFEITPSIPTPAPPVLPEIDFDAILTTISDFFEALISTLNEMVITLKEKTISAPPEQKAIENVERALGALSSMANAYSEFMKFIWEASGVEPSEYPEVKFNYHVLSSKFCENVDEAQTYMSSNGIESTDMNDALDLVKELELEKEGFCIVIVDYSFTGFGEKESGRYPIVCNEKGDPFWESWQFYENIKKEIEEAYKEYE